MKRLLVTSLVFLLLASSVAIADIVILKNGKRLEVTSAKIEGDFVTFMVFKGHMKISMKSVREVIHTDTPPAANAGLPISPVSTAPVANSGGNEGGNEGEEPQDENGEKASEQLLQSFLDRKVRLLNDKMRYENQIQTLSNQIFTLATQRKDSASARLKKEETMKLLDGVVNQIMNISGEARRAGLLPGDIRILDDTVATSNVEGAGSSTAPATRPGDSKSKALEIKDNPNRSKPAEWK
jgi:hypothetical protein